MRRPPGSLKQRNSSLNAYTNFRRAVEQNTTMVNWLETMSLRRTPIAESTEARRRRDRQAAAKSNVFRQADVSCDSGAVQDWVSSHSLIVSSAKPHRPN